jgi:hypothetical protein
VNAFAFSSRTATNIAAIGVAVVLIFTASRAADATGQFCSSADLAQVENRPNVDWSACVVELDETLLETGYYQNASSVGASAIAEYPNAQVRTGVASNLELVLNPPTQVDVSGNRGKGFFSLSDPGVGFKYQVADNATGAVDFGGEIRPPSTATSFRWQPEYQFQADSSQQVGRKLLATIGLGVVDDGRFSAVTPGKPALRTSAALGLAASHGTNVSVELVDQASVAKSLHGQTSGNLTLHEAIAKRVVFDLDGGQTFNTSAHSRPHYIGAGFAFATSP